MKTFLILCNHGLGASRIVKGFKTMKEAEAFKKELDAMKDVALRMTERLREDDTFTVDSEDYHQLGVKAQRKVDRIFAKDPISMDHWLREDEVIYSIAEVQFGD